MNLHYSTLILYMLCRCVGHLAADTPVQQAVTRVKTYQLVDTLITQLDALQLHSPKAEKVESAALLTTDQLPDDVWGHILGFCLVKEILAWAHVCKHLRLLIMDNPLKTVWDHTPVEINIKKLLFVNPHPLRLPVGIVALRLVQEDLAYEAISGKKEIYHPYDHVRLLIPWIGKQRYLKKFSCEGVNCLMELPEEVAELPHLEKLNVSYSHNQYNSPKWGAEWFPFVLYRLTNLKKLKISYDLLRLVPDFQKGNRVSHLKTMCVRSISAYAPPDHYAQLWDRILTLAPNLKSLTFEEFGPKERHAVTTHCPKSWRFGQWAFVKNREDKNLFLPSRRPS